jgi:5-methylcytosine-specific restriction endonuclease McrA
MNLEALAEARGVEYTEKPNGHVQLKGPLLVNYYPNSKSKSAYVAGTKKATKNVTAEQALDMCFEAPVLQAARPEKRSNKSREKRRKMISRGVTSCYWCKEPITLDTSTIEHIVPLARGGLDNANNRTLACKPCNEARGCDMPELK